MLEDSIMKTIYVEEKDGILSAYACRNDSFISGPTVKASIERNLGEFLCNATKEYNQSQDILYRLYHDQE